MDILELRRKVMTELKRAGAPNEVVNLQAATTICEHALAYANTFTSGVLKSSGFKAR